MKKAVANMHFRIKAFGLLAANINNGNRAKAEIIATCKVEFSINKMPKIKEIIVTITNFV